VRRWADAAMGWIMGLVISLVDTLAKIDNPSMVDILAICVYRLDGAGNGTVIPFVGFTFTLYLGVGETLDTCSPAELSLNHISQWEVQPEHDGRDQPRTQSLVIASDMSGHGWDCNPKSFQIF